jgi:ribonuclease BN (tRNA processing enzyme)
MSLFVQSRLVNAPDGDPGVNLDFHFARRAMLFDLGDLRPLSQRELLRVSHVFVSHAHMDHVAGFDPLLRLRLRLHCPRPLTVVGPPGFLDQVEHRLRSFTWNLLDAHTADFRLEVLEFDGNRVSAAAEFRAREAFARRCLPSPSIGEGRVLDEEALTIDATALDHRTPSLAFALHERLRVKRLAEVPARSGAAGWPMARRGQEGGSAGTSG